MTAVSPILSYKNIMELPEYMDYEFEPNWIFFYILFMICYSILPIFIFLKISFFFFTKSKTVKTNLRSEIFYSFWLMQFFNLMLVIADFAMFRIPYTALFTRYCAAEDPQKLLRTIVFCYFWATYASQLFTVLFCALRVAILYSMSGKVTGKIIRILPPMIIIFGLIAALPHFSTDSYCLQLPQPFVFGSTLIISKFHSQNQFVVYFNFFIYFSVTITILVLNMLMLYKIRQKKILNIRSASQATKIERALTGTMIILLFPMIVSLMISAIKILPPVIIIFGLIAALPHFSTESLCIYLLEPFVFGSFLVISKYHILNSYAQLINLSVYVSVAITITVLTVFMLLKIRRDRISTTLRSANQNAKIERTLTGTMLILLFPLIVSMLIALGEIFRIPLFHYFLLVRPLFLDARVHIATCYFYWTHPVFKKSSPHTSVSNLSA